jgi:hypothetical protein
MNDESRDPELQQLSRHWQIPPPSRDLDDAVMSAYRRRFVVRRRLLRFWIPLAAGVLIFALAILAVVRSKGNLFQAPQVRHTYTIVSQPKLIVVSQGERP